jgi:hypothetical protein
MQHHFKGNFLWLVEIMDLSKYQNEFYIKVQKIHSNNHVYWRCVG